MPSRGKENLSKMPNNGNFVSFYLPRIIKQTNKHTKTDFFPPRKVISEMHLEFF